MSFVAVSAGCSGHPAGSPSFTTVAPLPDPVGYAGMVAVATPAGLLAGGGANFTGKKPWEGGAKSFSDRLFAFDGVRWRDAGRLPRPLAYAACAPTTRGLLVAGGCDAGRCFADTFLLSPEGETVVLPALPEPVAFAAYAVGDECLYVIGGQSSPDAATASGAVHILDLRIPEAGWRTLPPLPGPGRILAVAGVMRGRLHVMGGVSLAPDATGRPVRTYLRDVVAYDAERGAWVPERALPAPLAATPGPAPVTGDAFVLAGGDTGEFAASGRPPREHPGQPSVVRLFRPDDGTWRDAGRLPVGVVTAPVATRDGAALIVSGECAPGIRTPQVVRVDLR